MEKTESHSNEIVRSSPLLLTQGITEVILTVMKTAISIPDDLFRAAEKVAKRLGLSRSELYRRALGVFLEQHNDQLVTDALNEVYSEDPSHSKIDVVLARMQAASLPPEEWR